MRNKHFNKVRTTWPVHHELQWDCLFGVWVYFANRYLCYHMDNINQIFMPPPLGARDILFAGCPFVRPPEARITPFSPIHASVGPSDQPWPFFGLSLRPGPTKRCLVATLVHKYGCLFSCVAIGFVWLHMKQNSHKMTNCHTNEPQKWCFVKKKKAPDSPYMNTWTHVLVGLLKNPSRPSPEKRTNLLLLQVCFEKCCSSHLWNKVLRGLSKWIICVSICSLIYWSLPWRKCHNFGIFQTILHLWKSHDADRYLCYTWIILIKFLCRRL